VTSVQTAAPALLLYDGLCGFCNGTVQWLLKHDQRDRFRFAPQQSALAEAVLLRHGINREAALSDNSVFLVLDRDTAQEKLLARSDVTVQALLLLGGSWSILGRLLQAVPKFLRDRAYTLVARNRFRFAGKYEVCPVPAAAQREKFVG